MEVIRRNCGRFMKMKSKSASADSYRIAEYSKQNDTVFALSKENKYWKEKYVQENKYRRMEVEILEAEVCEIKSKASDDMEKEGERYRSLLEETRRKEQEHALEYRQAEEENQKLKTELCAKINDLRFQHGLEKIKLEEQYDGETRAIRNACVEVMTERQKEMEEFEKEMNVRFEQARSETGRLKSAVARLREARAVDQAVSEMMDTTYIEMTLKEKDIRYHELMEKFTELSAEKNGLIRERDEKDGRLLLEYKAKEAELMKEAEERRKCSLVEKKTAAERERAIIRDMKCRMDKIKRNSEEEIEGLKRLNEEVTINLVREYEERERKLKSETSARSMRMLKSAKEREDDLKKEIANQTDLREKAENKFKILLEEYQKLVEEKKDLVDCLEKERQGRALDRSNALREKSKLMDALERQRETVLNEKNEMLSEKRQRESEWSEKMIKYDATLRGMTATRSTLDKRLELLETEFQEALSERTRLLQVIDERDERIRDQRKAFEKEIHEKENEWKNETEAMNSRYQSLLESERRRREEEMLQAAKEKEYLREVMADEASKYSSKLHLLEEDSVTLVARNADLLEEVRAKDEELRAVELMLQETKRLLEDSRQEHLNDLKEQRTSYESRLKKQVEEDKVKIEDLLSQKENYEKCLQEEKSKVKSYSEAVAELKVKVEENEKGFGKLLDTQKRNHDNELNAVKRKLEELKHELEEEKRKHGTCETQLADTMAGAKGLEKKIDWGRMRSKMIDLRRKHLKEMEQVVIPDGCKKDLDGREGDLLKREQLVDAKEKEIELRESRNKDTEFGLVKQETDMRNLKEKLRQEKEMLAELKEEMTREKEKIEARAADVENENERLEELEFNIERREEEFEKEKRRSALIPEKEPTRLPVDNNGFGNGSDPMEFVAKLEKQLAEQEWYFLSREGEFQNAKVENARYRKREEELEKLESDLQEKEKLIQSMEQEIQMKNATVESTMMEVTSIRNTLMNDSRYKSKKDRSSQASEEKIAAELESRPSSRSRGSGSVACGKADELDQEMSSEPYHEKMKEKNPEKSEDAQKENKSLPNDSTISNNEQNEKENKMNNDENSKPTSKDKESSSNQTKVTIHYNIEDDDATESEPRHTASHPKPIGDERFYIPVHRRDVAGKKESVLNQVYSGQPAPACPPRDSYMPPRDYNRGPPPPPFGPRFFRPPPPGVRPMLRPPPFGRPMPRGGPYPRPPPPPRDGRGFFRPPPPYGPYGRRPPPPWEK